PFIGALQQEPLTSARRQELIRWTDAIKRERGFVRDRAVRATVEYMREHLLANDLVVLYGYSSTVCESIIRRGDANLITIVVEDLQYGSNSVREHELVHHALFSAGLPCHVIPFTQLDHLLQANFTSVSTLDDQRLNLSPRRTLLAFLGCDAISVDGSVLIPAVLAGKPSDSACLAEAFLASHDDQRVPRRL